MINILILYGECHSNYKIKVLIVEQIGGGNNMFPDQDGATKQPRGLFRYFLFTESTTISLLSESGHRVMELHGRQ